MTYEAQISRNSPTAFLFVVDQSGSMADKMSSGKSKAEFVSDALNRTLVNLVTRCTKSEGVRDYFEVGVLGYGGTGVANGFSGTLGSKVLNPISAILQPCSTSLMVNQAMVTQRRSQLILAELAPMTAKFSS